GRGTRCRAAGWASAWRVTSNRHWSSLELRVSAAIVQQRSSVARLGAVEVRDEDGVVTAVEAPSNGALQVRERIVEEDDTVFATRVGDSVEPLLRLVGEAS